ncbi:dihydroorotate dehydrogenase [Biscogniauxia marginata]|nr:dihydroorotate dehydrogenase [Biscogniauxia marginata]
MGDLPPPIHIVPPLLNSANPWATTREDLKRLFECPSTGAVTTRTCLPNGFPHDPSVHQYTFFNPSTHVSSNGPFSVPGPASAPVQSTETEDESASLNNLGYSPIPLDEYLGYIREISASLGERSSKLIIVSVTGAPGEVARCYLAIARLQPSVVMPLAMEVNLSCPNIPGKPPPAYEGGALVLYVRAICAAAAEHADGSGLVRIPWGLKTPPYTHAGQFETLVGALLLASSAAENDASATSTSTRPCPLSFLTATNTLGSCLVLEEYQDQHPSTPKLKLAGATGIGGLAGAPLHPLALGNVATLRRMLDAREATRHVALVGVGGVGDAAGYRRMRSVGAAAVGVGTALGRRGVGVFAEIEEGLGGRW